MNRQPAPGTAWADRLRQVAAAFLLFAFAIFILQSAAHAGFAGQMTHGDQLVAATGQDCAHSPMMQDGTRLDAAEPCSSDDLGSSLRHDCCIQLCTLAVVLPGALSMDPPQEDDVLSVIWSHRSGRTPSRILRPPRLFAII
ncbi:MAG: hypothetical protein B7Z30_01540 [Rhizobiales bacterium 12-68-15]|nr:MAG: hypothetical protein B7Z30_01540 [Rhizobiales bacterium 12-68-15]